MNDLIKESASELDKLPCINYNLYFGSPADRADKFDDEGEPVRITYDEAIDELLDWHTKQMEKVYEKGREETLKDLLEYVQLDVNFGAENQQVVSTKAQARILALLKN
tara:strand:- start:4471 stop:4794 length:324 start_codon:yes stop_codon:yes gene_type:complete